MLGFQGFGNVGDEAILEGIAVAGDGILDVRILFVGTGASIPGFPAAHRVRLGRLWPLPRALRSLRSLDALVISGGGLVNDYWPTLIPRYVAWVVAARMIGLRILWLGVGVGPIRRRSLRVVAGLGFRMSSLVAVRDAYSAEVVRGCPAAPPSRRIPDPAFFNETVPWQGGDGLALILRPPAPGSEHHREHLLGVISEVVARAAGAGKEVHLISMHPAADEVFMAELVRRVEMRGGNIPATDALPLGARAAAERLARFDGIVTMRLHGLILGALAGVPAVPIVYDEKVAEAARVLGLDDVAIGLDELQPDRVLDALERVGSGERRIELLARVDAIRAELPAVRELLGAALG